MYVPLVILLLAGAKLFYEVAANDHIMEEAWPLVGTHASFHAKVHFVQAAASVIRNSDAACPLFVCCYYMHYMYMYIYIWRLQLVHMAVSDIR